MQERFAITKRLVDIQQTQGLAVAAKEVASGAGRRVTDQIRRVALEMIDAEERSIAADAERTEAQAHLTLELIVLRVVLALVFLAWVGYKLHRRESAHHLALETLRRSEARFNQLLEFAPDGMIVVNQANQIVLVNALTEKQFGYRREELLHQPMDVLIPERLRPQHAAHRGNLFGDPTTKSIGAATHLLGRRMDGTEFPIEVSLGRIEGEEEPLISASIRDVSERMELEEKLLQSQKMDAVGRLAGGIAHDFNNLLTVINGYSDLLLRTLDARDPAREKISKVRSAGQHAADLTQQLLAFSRKQVLQPKVLDLNRLVSEVDKILGRLLGEDINIVTAFSSRTELVMMDSGQMTQLLMNLAVNARDAMPNGGQLVIETDHLEFDETYTKDHAGMKPGPVVQLTVSDSGTGMDDATKSHIFEPFFTTKEQGAGTGLGLATVYGIVHQAGGSIWLYSELGKGTTFKIYLPRVNQAIPRPEPGPETKTLLGNQTVLVVEDQPDLRRLVQEILQSYGYQVLAAANGEEALLQAGQHAGPIQLMLTNVIMPGMNGRQLADRIRPQRPEMKILYMSGYTDDIVVHRGIVDLNAAYIQKPFTPESLAVKVKDVLEDETFQEPPGV